MKFALSSWSLAGGAGVLIALSCIGLRFCRPTNTPVKLVVFYLCAAGLLGGGVVLSGTLIRAVIKWCGCSDAAARKVFRHFIGVGFSAVVACLLAHTVGMLACIPIQQKALRTLVSALLQGVAWPVYRLSLLGWELQSWWWSRLVTSLFWGLALYGSGLLVRHF